ncbi:MAG: DUF2911 domain-containing protein [Cyclobacteriaceae bacterium]|nr:DUF2911 domain-containing protein [Cyclobacteriaceae bacterium]
MMFRGFALLITISLLTDCVGQITHPRISPQAKLVQHVGLTTIEVDYSRPGVRGRKIIGELVPYGRIWRVGANESTKITFSDSVMINQTALPPATYALYAIPEAEQWTIIFHNNINHWGDGRTNYNSKEDALRFVVKPQRTKSLTETFTIEFDSITHNRAVMVWRWEYTQVSFVIQVNTQQKMLEHIRQQLAGNPTGMTYYEAARYLQEENIFPEKAKLYLESALKLLGDTYYVHRVWSLVEAQLGNLEEAIRHAKVSKELSAKEGKDEFVRMNEKSIQEWTVKVKKK